MNIQNLPEDSDTSDEDYVPGGQDEEVVSEVDSSGELIEPSKESEEVNYSFRRKRVVKKKDRSKRRIIKHDSGESGNSKEKGKKQSTHNPEVEKKKEDSLWADFMKDTGFTPKNNKNQKQESSNSTSKTNTRSDLKKNDNSKKENSPRKTSETVKITKVFDFAGEVVKVDKEVAANSAEAKLLKKESEQPISSKGKRSGISNVLNQLTKKPKISVLEKTKLDWDQFKKDEKLEEELQTHNKGKDGYLDKQDFLQRADLRRFEIEKELRSVERNKRFNSTL